MFCSLNQEIFFAALQTHLLLLCARLTITHTHTQLFAAKPSLEEDFSEDDLLSSACSSRRGSITSTDVVQTSVPLFAVNEHSRVFRRRSSTSDALRFKEKLQSLSQSADMHENMMAESPMEQDLDSDAGERIIENTNANNNSPRPNVSGRLDSKNKAMSSEKHTDRVKMRLKTHVRAISDTTTITVTTHTSNGDSNSKDGSGVSSESGAKITTVESETEIADPSSTVAKKALKTQKGASNLKLQPEKGDDSYDQPVFNVGYDL